MQRIDSIDNGDLRDLIYNAYTVMCGKCHLLGLCHRKNDINVKQMAQCIAKIEIVDVPPHKNEEKD